jgi:hypothetical protein
MYSRGHHEHVIFMISTGLAKVRKSLKLQHIRLTLASVLAPADLSSISAWMGPGPTTQS